MKYNKLIVILGPTATGKTKLAARLATKYNGEIISADSRQVYRGMDIGTGKDLPDYRVGNKVVPHHLIDVLSPKTGFNVAKYQRLASRAIKQVQGLKKLPFLVGGTGLYIDSIIRGYQFFPTGGKSLGWRQKLDKLTLAQLLVRLRKVDLATYQIIDHKNRRRVQRALEIYYQTGRPKSQQLKMSKPDYDLLVIGIKYTLKEIYQRIDSRLEKRIKEGMIKEIKKLRQVGVSWKRLDEFGLEYRYVSSYLRGRISYEEMLDQLKNAIHHFAKRQLTWFKRNKDIAWVSSYQEAEKLVRNFLE